MSATGIMFLVVFPLALHEQVKMLRHGRRTVGVVVGHQRRRSQAKGSASKLHSAVVQFTTEDGRTVQALESMSSSRPPALGKQIPIIYDPAAAEGGTERPGNLRFQIVIFALFPLGAAGSLVAAVALLLR